MTEPSTVYLEDLCSVIRSKNAGPFLITLDMMFKEASTYNAIKDSDSISKTTIAQAYGITIDEVLVLEYIDSLHAIKATIKRQYASGSPGDADVYGMNQEGPLLGLSFPTSMFDSPSQ